VHQPFKQNLYSLTSFLLKVTRIIGARGGKIKVAINQAVTFELKFRQNVKGSRLWRAEDRLGYNPFLFTRALYPSLILQGGLSWPDAFPK
jgi:hypothetical protein